MANTVVGFFDSASEAQKAVEQLVAKGFNRSDIDLSSGGNTGGSNYSTSDSSYTGSSATTTGNTHQDGDHDSGNAVSRFFKNLFGGDDDEANRYATVGQRSEAIVTVHANSDDEAERAADLLDDYGAVNVDERASQYGYSSKPMSDTTSASMSDTSSTTYSDTTANTNREGVIPVIQEDLQVGKRTVETGGVRVRSRIVQKPVEESIRLREEKVTVERTPVNRVVSTGDLNTFQEQNIELTETAEVPVVSKEARVVEEIRVTKDASEREETIHDTVRNTEVDVENIEGKTTTRGTGYNTTSGTGSTGTGSGSNSGV